MFRSPPGEFWQLRFVALSHTRDDIKADNQALSRDDFYQSEMIGK